MINPSALKPRSTRVSSHSLVRCGTNRPTPSRSSGASSATAGLQGFKFRRQVPIAGYIIDFYCHDAHLGVELDGGQHNDEEGKRYDDGRTAALGKIGVRVIRFWNL